MPPNYTHHLPDKVDRIILSGGEPLAEKKKLYLILDTLKDKYAGETQIMLQTNGDLLTNSILKTLLEKGVTRFDIASIDRYHKNKGERLEFLSNLFKKNKVHCLQADPLIKKDNYFDPTYELSWGYWGANEEMWLGGNWARGRALETNNWLKDPDHNFCSILSGAIGFLGSDTNVPQEVSIQLWKINPCCPGTKLPMGDARIDFVSEVLQKVSKIEVFQKLNEGNPYQVGESVGVSEEFARKRCHELKSVCLWCDEFFEKHFKEES